jgi:hypothetical protein
MEARRRRRRIPRKAQETQWEIRHGTRTDQPVFPVRALLSWDHTRRRLHILVAEEGDAEELARFALRSLALLRHGFPDTHHEIVFWGEADESGLRLMAEEAARAVVPGQRVPYEMCRLRLS